MTTYKNETRNELQKNLDSHLNSILDSYNNFKNYTLNSYLSNYFDEQNLQICNLNNIYSNQILDQSLIETEPEIEPEIEPEPDSQKKSEYNDLGKKNNILFDNSILCPKKLYFKLEISDTLQTGELQIVNKIVSIPITQLVPDDTLDINFISFKFNYNNSSNIFGRFNPVNSITANLNKSSCFNQLKSLVSLTEKINIKEKNIPIDYCKLYYYEDQTQSPPWIKIQAALSSQWSLDKNFMVLNLNIPEAVNQELIDNHNSDFSVEIDIPYNFAMFEVGSCNGIPNLPGIYSFPSKTKPIPIGEVSRSDIDINSFFPFLISDEENNSDSINQNINTIQQSKLFDQIFNYELYAANYYSNIFARYFSNKILPNPMYIDDSSVTLQLFEDENIENRSSNSFDPSTDNIDSRFILNWINPLKPSYEENIKYVIKTDGKSVTNPNYSSGSSLSVLKEFNTFKSISRGTSVEQIQSRDEVDYNYLHINPVIENQTPFDPYDITNIRTASGFHEGFSSYGYAGGLITRAYPFYGTTVYWTPPKALDNGVPLVAGTPFDLFELGLLGITNNKIDELKELAGDSDKSNDIIKEEIKNLLFRGPLEKDDDGNITNVYIRHTNADWKLLQLAWTNTKWGFFNSDSGAYRYWLLNRNPDNKNEGRSLYIDSFFGKDDIDNLFPNLKFISNPLVNPYLYITPIGSILSSNIPLDILGVFSVLRSIQTPMTQTEKFESFMYNDVSYNHYNENSISYIFPQAWLLSNFNKGNIEKYRNDLFSENYRKKSKEPLSSTNNIAPNSFTQRIQYKRTYTGTTIRLPLNDFTKSKIQSGRDYNDTEVTFLLRSIKFNFRRNKLYYNSNNTNKFEDFYGFYSELDKDDYTENYIYNSNTMRQPGNEIIIRILKSDQVIAKKEIYLDLLNDN